MLDLVQEIESYSPQTGQTKPQNPYNSEPQTFQNKTPLIEPPLKDQDIAAQKSQQEEAKSCLRFLKLKYYVEFFKVSEIEVLQRLKYSMVPPFKEQFIDTIKSNPDFYGPIWIATTILFLLSMIRNFSNYIESKFSNDQIWNEYFFTLQLVRYGFIFVYTFALGAPALLFFTLKIMGNPIDLPLLICTYGYASTCFIFAILLCIFPITFLQWIFLIYAFANSTLFLILSLKKHIDGVKQKAIFGVIAATQLTYFLCCKYIFLS